MSLAVAAPFFNALSWAVLNDMKEFATIISINGVNSNSSKCIIGAVSPRPRDVAASLVVADALVIIELFVTGLAICVALFLAFIVLPLFSSDIAANLM